MTSEQIEAWKVERDIARKSGNQELVQKAYDHKDDMMMTCIAHQSQRTKQLVSDIGTMKRELASCVESDKDYRINKERAKGVRLALEAGKWLAGAGLGGLLVQLLSH